MRKLGILLVALTVLACDDPVDDRVATLVRTESKSYTGFIAYTEYDHDRFGRITMITRRIDDEAPVVLANISYNNNEVVILSTPDFDPAYNQTTEVHLTINDEGLTSKRTEYTHRTPKVPGAHGVEFTYDTLIFEYSAGLVTKTFGHRYDSSASSPTSTRVVRSTSAATYTNEAGNVIAVDTQIDYPIVTREGGTTTLSGGSSRYLTNFNYSKSYPNKTDFRNAAVLNEYKEYYEQMFNASYKSMPDQVVRSTVDKDHEGTIIFTITTTVDMERTYNENGFLSSLKIPANTQYREVNYFYR